MDLKVSNGVKFNFWTLGWSIGVILFALIVVWQNRGLTFFWDEWDVVAATLESEYFGILQDNGGNFFPLSRIVFGVELALFGSWYPGYMFVTSLLFGVTTLAFNLLLDDGTKTRRILLTAFSLIYLSSTGVLFASSMGFMLKWALSPLLAVIAAGFFVRSSEADKNQKAMLFFGWLFFLLSWASFSSSIILMALLIVGLIHFAPQASNGKSTATLQIRFSALILALSVVLALIGLRLADFNPPVNPLTGRAEATIGLISTLDIREIVVSGIAASFADLVSVVIALPLHSNELNSWLNIAIRDYLLILSTAVVLGLVLIYLFKKSTPDRKLILAFLVLLASNFFLSAARSPLIHRYQTLWIPIAILVIFALLTWLAKINLRAINTLIVLVVVIAGTVSLWHITSGALSIATVERQRDIADANLLNNSATCLSEAAFSLEQIAPTISAPKVCQLIETLNRRSWILTR